MASLSTLKDAKRTTPIITTPTATIAKFAASQPTSFTSVPSGIGSGLNNVISAVLEVVSRSLMTTKVTLKSTILAARFSKFSSLTSR